MRGNQVYPKHVPGEEQAKHVDSQREGLRLEDAPAFLRAAVLPTESVSLTCAVFPDVGAERGPRRNEAVSGSSQSAPRVQRVPRSWD